MEENKKIMLVDFENAGNKGLNGYEELSSEDTIVIFDSENNKFSSKKMNKLREGSNANILNIHVDITAKNSLDFTLVSYLSLMIGMNKNNDTDYYIISKDNGYRSAIQLLTNTTNVNIVCQKSISGEIKNKEYKYTKLYEDMRNELKTKFSKNKTCRKVCDIIFTSNDIEDCRCSLYEFFNGSLSYGEIDNRVNKVLKMYFGNVIELKGAM